MDNKMRIGDILYFFLIKVSQYTSDYKFLHKETSWTSWNIAFSAFILFPSLPFPYNNVLQFLCLV